MPYRKYNGYDFWISTGTSHVQENGGFFLHNHENVCEILFFIKGDSSFVVEGTTYPLTPESFIIARHDEMHRVEHHCECDYDRVVINFGVDFFENNGCEEYAAAFFERPAGSGNLFTLENSREAVEALRRLTAYVDEGAPVPLVRGVLCEVLRFIAKREEGSEGNVTSPRLREIILYINENLVQNITLEDLSKQFFISKYHLCRLFKKETGMTFVQYVTKKRLMRVTELNSGGMSLTEAALASGFSDYSSYWHANKRNIAEYKLRDN